MRELKIDITFETEIGNGLHMGIQCCNMIKAQIGRYPEGLIETQVLLIKKFIAIKDLNSPYRGKCL
jgi:DNA polymerase sigma